MSVGKSNKHHRIHALQQKQTCQSAEALDEALGVDQVQEHGKAKPTTITQARNDASKEKRNAKPLVNGRKGAQLEDEAPDHAHARRVVGVAVGEAEVEAADGKIPLTDPFLSPLHYSLPCKNLGRTLRSIKGSKRSNSDGFNGNAILLTKPFNE